MPEASEWVCMAKQILKVAVVLILVALIWKLVIEDEERGGSEEVDRID